MNPLLKMSPTITNMIRKDHSDILVTFHQYSTDKNIQTKQTLAESICIALEIHAQLEEDIFYPALNNLIYHETVLAKSVFEHDELRRLIIKLRALQPDNIEFDATFMQLMRNTLHHVADEETFILPDAEKILDNQKLHELGVEMRKLRLKLMPSHTSESVDNTVTSLEQNPLIWMASLIFLFAGLYALRQSKHH